MKSVLPWILVLALGAGAGVLFVSGQTKDAELAKLREQSRQAEELRARFEETMSRAQAQQEEIAGLRKDLQDLPRLRNEVVQLRTEAQKLAKQAQTAQAQAEHAQAQISQTMQSSSQQMQQLQSENQQLRTVAVQGQQMVQRNVCINNLRQLDGAKQQWALEHNQTAVAVPTPQDLAPYLNANALPSCPAGGAYTLNALNQSPTCSVPGHALPR